MPTPTRDEKKQAAEHCLGGDNGSCAECRLDGENCGSSPCSDTFARALLSAYEREEKMLEAVKVGREAMRERRLYGDAWERKYGDKWDDEDAQVDSAIKAIEERCK